MKTFLYSLFKRCPISFDDWVDFLGKERDSGIPAELSLTLDYEESIVEGAVVYKLCANYSGGTDGEEEPHFQKVYGGFLESDGSHKKKRCYLSAEKKLKQDLEKLSQIGIKIRSDTEAAAFPSL